MPLAQKSVGEIPLPARTAKLLPATDVLVVGGGPAGIGAAMGAAKAGAKVLLAERHGFLGGNATAGLVIIWASYHTSTNKPQLGAQDNLFYPKDHGEGKPAIGGVLKQLVDRLVAAHAALPPSPQTGYMVPFDPETLKLEALNLLDEAGVELLFHAFASGVLMDGKRVSGVVFESKSGPLVAQAKVIVDCTGDGDVAAFAGADFEVGRSRDSMVQPMTLMFILEGLSRRRFGLFATEHPDQWRGVKGLTRLMQKATAKGELHIPREEVLMFGSLHPNQVLVNSTRVLNTLGTDVWDLTRAELEGRRQVAELTRFFRRYVPGFEEAYVQQSGISAVVRESRRIIGEYRLTAKDVIYAHKFKDAIALGTYPIDLHNPSGKGTLLKKIQPENAYDIPLRCLIPLKLENLLVGGRCISGTHIANASYRTMPICIATGQAAGVCAAYAAKSGKSPRDVYARTVQKELLRQGAILQIEKVAVKG
jgi:glycine/D-amino acid oxidase-like deaminating enzyme